MLETRTAESQYSSEKSDQWIRSGGRSDRVRSDDVPLPGEVHDRLLLLTIAWLSGVDGTEHAIGSRSKGGNQVWGTDMGWG